MRSFLLSVGRDMFWCVAGVLNFGIIFLVLFISGCDVFEFEGVFLSILVGGFSFLFFLYKVYNAACLFQIRSRLYSNDFKIKRMDPWKLLDDKKYRKEIVKMMFKNMWNVSWKEFR